MEFKFASGYNCNAHYTVVDYGKPYHGKRLGLYSVAPSLEGPPKMNYTPEDYNRYVVDVVGYLYWEYSPTSPVPVEFAREFNAESTAQHERFLEKMRTKYPNDTYTPDPPYMVKGVAYLLPEGQWVDSDGDTRTVYRWEKETI